MERGFNYSVPIKNLVAQEVLPSHLMMIMIQTIYRLFTVVKIISAQCLQLSLTRRMAIVPAHTLTILITNDLAYFALIIQLKGELVPEGLLSVFQLTFWDDRNRWTLKMQKWICFHHRASHHHQYKKKS